MADVITRLKVDSKEYDSKITRARDGLLQLERAVHDAGETFIQTWKDEQEFAKGLGQMQTVSKSAAGQLGELKQAFTDISLLYKRMTDEEKNSPFGKGIASSLKELKQRIDETKKDLEDINNELNGSSGLSGALDAIASKFGLSTKQLTAWGAAIAAGKVAMDTIKGAIESTEATHDAFARATAVSDNITNQFLRSLATADFSNFLGGMQSIINKTIDAYNAMDEFESFAARFQPWQQSKEADIQTKLQQARAAKAQGDTQKAEQLTQEAKRLIDELAKSTKAYGEKQTEGGYSTIRSLMGGVDITDKQIAWYADPSNWEKTQAAAKKYKDTIDALSSAERKLESASRSANLTMITKADNAYKDAKKAAESLTPMEKRAYTIQNLRDSGDSEQAKAFKQALGNIYGNSLAESRIESLRARADRMDGVITHSNSGSVNIKNRPRTPEVEKELTIQQQIATLEKEAVTASQERRVEIGKQVQELDKQLQVQKEIIEALHKSVDPLSVKAGDPSKMGVSVIGDSREQTLQQSVSNIAKSARVAIENTDITDPLMAKFQSVFADSTALGNLIKAALQNEIDTSDINFSVLKDKIKQGIDIDDSALQEIVEKINEKLKEVGKDPIKLDVDTGSVTSATKDLTKDAKQNQQAWSAAASAVSNLSGALQSLDDPSAKIAGIVGQAVANIALGFAQASASPATGAAGVFGWIAAATAGLATMVATITQIKSVTKGFAEGGIVPGNHYSGDLLSTADYGINSGELILNRAQQDSIASQLTDGNGGQGNTGTSLVSVDCENIRIVLKNGATRRGMSVSEYLQL